MDCADNFDDRLRDLHRMVGERGILTGSDTEPYCQDWRGIYRGRTPAVLRPDTVGQVADIVRFCAENRIGLVPQGGNTGLVGGATPSADGSQIVLSLSRMNRVRAVDPIDRSMVVEAGLTLKAAQDAAAQADCLLPLSISSEGTAQIGGILAVNAGGNNTLRHGTARDLVLGIEAVLPDGAVWNGLRRLRKDNTGYCLRQLLVGSEGTLGVITAAVLKLAPRARQSELALCAVPSADAALALLKRFNDADPASLSAFEYISGGGMDLVLAHIPGAMPPLSERSDHYILIELTTPREGETLRAELEQVLGSAIEDGVVGDAILAESGAQRTSLWRLREEQAESQKRAGASVKNDISVPIPAIPALLAEAGQACRDLLPGIRIVPFGHLGDGNIHFNLVQPPDMSAAAFHAREGAIMAAVNDVARRLGGSFSAEHGIGQSKAGLLPDWRGGAELAAMRAIKAALDPHDIMNPGKVLQPAAI